MWFQSMPGGTSGEPVMWMSPKQSTRHPMSLRFARAYLLPCVPSMAMSWVFLKPSR